MNQTIKQLLEGRADNHMLPFFWQRGEDEAKLREYMDAIHKANCFAVCVESRPHPDFAGPKWWADMDVILDEARKRNMKVWILDDSHFPTGYCNGAIAKLPEEYSKQNLFMNEKVLEGTGAISVDLRAEGLLVWNDPRINGTPARVFDDESILFVFARKDSGETVDLTAQVENETLHWEKPEGNWTLQVGVRSRNTGGRRDQMSVTEEMSSRVLIDNVHEPHWQHYAEDFGKTIVGFFSDEPELGNGPTYGKFNFIGTAQDLPWGPEVEAAVSEALGKNWLSQLPLLWKDGKDAPRVRTLYMDCVTKLVRKNFSYQIGDWCREHGVEYIGHVIEDDGQHCRTGSSLGHYFRGLQGQDMAGIDNIGGQILPQGEGQTPGYFRKSDLRNGDFYQYALAKLAQSAAAIEPAKHGNAMCEIFGNYGWSEGVRLEKYQADHCLVRGINHYVPHAFSPREFPDPDCPPHFYAHGHDAQIRHFGEICGYMNRVSTLTSSGKQVVPIAILYHGESEWADSNTMPFETPLKELYDRQFDCHVIPADVFTEPEYYPIKLGNPFNVNGQLYHAFVVPETTCLPQAAAEGLSKLAECGLPIYFVNKLPTQVSETGEPLSEVLQSCKVVALSDLAAEISKLNLSVPVVTPSNDRIRILQIDGDTPMYFIVNEADKAFDGTITLCESESCYLYDPWDNACYAADATVAPKGTQVKLHLDALKSTVIVCGDCEVPFAKPVSCKGKVTELTEWKRSVCEGSVYPAFEQQKDVTVPENVGDDLPEFSGYIRYETILTVSEKATYSLEITDAMEGVEVFVNGESLGIQVAPPFLYDLTDRLVCGENSLVIEVATSLERQAYPIMGQYLQGIAQPFGKTGLTGTVRLYQE